MNADSDKLVAWLREAADEIETAHAVLDHLDVPDGPSDDGTDGTLAARIVLLHEQEGGAGAIPSGTNAYPAQGRKT